MHIAIRRARARRRSDLHTQPPATALTRARARKFLSYYRPHLPLLAADLACAILVAATALADCTRLPNPPVPPKRWLLLLFVPDEPVSSNSATLRGVTTAPRSFA